MKLDSDRSTSGVFSETGVWKGEKLLRATQRRRRQEKLNVKAGACTAVKVSTRFRDIVTEIRHRNGGGRSPDGLYTARSLPE